MTASAIRPAWTPLTILLTIVGFIVWWPLGLAMLAYIIWGDQMTSWGDRLGSEIRGFGARMPRRPDFAPGRYSPTGNVAFDEYRAETLRRLEEERRRVDEEQREFGEFLRTLRQARDKEEFDRFMNDRRDAPRP